MSPEAVGTIIATILLALLGSGMFVVKQRGNWISQGRSEAQRNVVTIEPPVPLIQTQEKPTLVTREDLEAHLKRIDGNMRGAKEDTEAALCRFQDSHNKCQKFQDSQHAANQKRLDDQVKALARMEGMVASVQHTVNTLLDLALNKKPTSRS